MAKIFNVPSEIRKPKLDFTDFEAYERDCERYENEIRAWINQNGYNGKNAGEIIRFQVADGYARYMVLQMRPTALIHIDTMDAWHFQYAHILSAKEIQDAIDKEKALNKLFKTFGG
jgi:hypothetical protein